MTRTTFRGVCGCGGGGWRLRGWAADAAARPQLERDVVATEGTASRLAILEPVGFTSDAPELGRFPGVTVLGAGSPERGVVPASLHGPSAEDNFSPERMLDATHDGPILVLCGAGPLIALGLCRL